MNDPVNFVMKSFPILQKYSTMIYINVFTGQTNA